MCINSANGYHHHITGIAWLARLSARLQITLNQGSKDKAHRHDRK